MLNLEILMKVVFNFLYPRLDVNVSHSTNHLLKAPFSIHPATKKVCVPFDPNNIENFDLSMVPDLESTCNGNYEFVKAVRLFESYVDIIKKAASEERKTLLKDIRSDNEMNID